MKVLVTGRDGQLARSLAERAAGREDIELLAIGRPELDFEVPGSATRAIADASPDVVINAAAYTAVDQAEDEPERAFRINADAAGEVAEAAREAGAAIIQMSTDYVFDGRSAGPYSEDAATNPLGAYGRSKLAGEEQVRAANPDHLIVRTSWVYSRFGRNFVKTIMTAAQDRDVLSVVDDQRGCPTSALDLADALLLAIERRQASGRTGFGATYHLASPSPATWFEVAQHVMSECRRLGLPTAEVTPVTSSQWPTRAPRPGNSALDSTLFETDFGHRLPNWRDSVGAVVKRLAEGAADA